MISLDRECDAFCRALVGRDAPPSIHLAYRRAHETGAVGAADSEFDAWLALVAARGPGWTRFADSYAVLFACGGLLRRKLIFLLAILESHAETARLVDAPRSRSAAEFFARAALAGAVFAGRAVVAAVYFGGAHAFFGRGKPRA